MPTIGVLRHRVVLEAAMVTRSATGAEIKTWNADCDAADLQDAAAVVDVGLGLAARIDTSGGREWSAAKAVTAELTHLVTMRWRKSILPSKRLRYDDPKDNSTRYFDIRAVVNPDEKKIWLQLHCV